MPGPPGSATLRLEMDAERICRVEELDGKHVVCPEDACVFWEPGGAVLEGHCVLHGIDFEREPGLAAWFVEVRRDLSLPDAPQR